jgi:hypothetical protein
MVKTLANGDKPFDVFVWSWNFGHVLQILPKHLKIYQCKSCAESPRTHFIFMVALLVLSGKCAKLPSKLGVTVHRDKKILQIGIWISPSFWVQFKIGFSQILEEPPIYNFPIYRFWSLKTNSWELCRATWALGTDRAEARHGATSCTRASTRRRRAPPYYGRPLESVCERGVRQPRTHLQEPPRPDSPRATWRVRARRGAVGAPTAHARQGRCTRALKRQEGLASKRGASARASAIKGRPLLLPRMSTAAASSHSRKLPPPANPS